MRAGLNCDNRPKKGGCQAGFTLIEAIVSMVMFGVSFAGLFLLFGIAQQTSINTQKKMFLNLMANRIVETIANEGTNTNTAINPFSVPALYNGSISDCTVYAITDVPNYKYHWCNDLKEQVGPFSGYSGEERMVSVVMEGADLYVDVSLIVDGGMDGQNLVRSYFSRRLRQGQL